MPHENMVSLLRFTWLAYPLDDLIGLAIRAAKRLEMACTPAAMTKPAALHQFTTLNRVCLTTLRVELQDPVDAM